MNYADQSVTFAQGDPPKEPDDEPGPEVPPPPRPTPGTPRPGDPPGQPPRPHDPPPAKPEPDSPGPVRPKDTGLVDPRDLTGEQDEPLPLPDEPISETPDEDNTPGDAK
ncbi:MAG: hypothetical protein R3E01_02385 [Pirellulaceae bacterium]